MTSLNNNWEPTIGDVVIFNGSEHFASAMDSTAYPSKCGKAKITQIYLPNESKHPYHLVRIVGEGSTVYGWVDRNTFEKE